MPTTIQIMDETKHKLDLIKKHPRETYDEVVRRMMELNEEDSLEFNEETKKAIERGKDDIKKGKVYSTKELIEKLGI